MAGIHLLEGLRGVPGADVDAGNRVSSLMAEKVDWSLDNIGASPPPRSLRKLPPPIEGSFRGLCLGFRV
jgi:hypothetical protein